MDRLFSFFIRSDFIKAQILAVVRHLITAAGVTLIAHGWADSGMIESFSGFATVAVSFYLSQRDVKQVDTKILTALVTTVPQETEQQITARLNKMGRYGTTKG